MYFVKDAAEVEVFGNESMTVVGSKALFGEAIDAIRRGAEEALKPHGLGATIHIDRILLHPVDFHPSRFAACTATEVQRLVTTHDAQSKGRHSR